MDDVVNIVNAAKPGDTLERHRAARRLDQDRQRHARRPAGVGAGLAVRAGRSARQVGAPVPWGDAGQDLRNHQPGRRRRGRAPRRLGDRAGPLRREPAALRAGRGGRDRRRVPAQVRGRRRVRQPELEEVDKAVENAGLTMVQLNGDEGPSFCAEVARRTGVKVIKAIHVASAADVHAAEAFRTDYHLFDRRGKGLWGGTGESFDWGLLAEHRSEVPGDRRRRAAARQRRRGDRRHPPLRGRRRQRGRGRAGPQGPRGDGRVLRGRARPLASRLHERGRGALRPLRGPLRARDADPGARRADRRLGQAREDEAFARAAGAAAPRLHRPPDAALPRRAALRAGRRAPST